MRHPLDIARLYLERPDATAEQLRYVHQHLRLFPESEHLAVVETLVRNPNCPPTLFALLLPSARDAALQNPTWLLYLIEGDLLGELDVGFIHRTLREETAPAALLEALTLHAVPWVARAAQQHVVLAGEAGAGWEEAVLSDWSARLWRDGSLVWLSRAGALPETVNQRLPYPLEQQPRVSEPERQKILRTLSRQRGISLATVLAIAQTENPLPSLAQSPRWETRLALALNPASGLLQKHLRNDGHVWVRAAARGSEGIL